MPDEHNLNGSAPNASARFGAVPQDSERFRSAPNGSESFRPVPHNSEEFRTVPQTSEPFGPVPPLSERKASHTHTTREVARMFEDAGVARTERTIVKWCQPHGGAPGRLDAFFDPNERRYFITQESVERAIKEEQSKAVRPQLGTESFRTIPNEGADARKEQRPETNDRDAEELRLEIMDLKIATRAKDQFIAQLQGEREQLMERAIEQGRTIGQLETKLLALEAPQDRRPDSVRLRVKSHPSEGEAGTSTE